MSAILKTLKKLEEEKSVLDQNLDIEEMVTQGEALPPSLMRSRKTGVAAILLGLVVVALAAYLVLRSAGPESQAARLEPARPGPAAPAVNHSPVLQAALTPNTAPSPLGIPLARIPETVKPAESPAEPTPRDAEQPPSPDARQALPPAAPPDEVPEALKKNVPPLVPLNEIHALIESATRAAERAADQPPEINPRRNAAYIPGLKIKGIVYLAEGSPINHILVSTPDASNLKMRVGENVLGATLESIQPDRAVFLYKGRLTETGIGE
ncbi:MAG: hypothetical protein ACE5G9_13455 [Nitrospinales bacterium]